LKELTGVWKKLNNQGNYDLQQSPSGTQLKKSEVCGKQEEKINIWRVSVEKPEGRRPHSRPRKVG